MPWVFLTTQLRDCWDKLLAVPPVEAGLLYIITNLLGMRQCGFLLLERRVLLGAPIGEQPAFGVLL